MSSFTTPLIVSYLNGRNWKLEENFIYYTKSSEIFLCSLQIKVPKGFVTNFASTPRILWPIFPPTGKYGKAAVVHDYIYSNGSFKRKQCDKIFKEAMEVLGVPRWKINLMYYAVRIFAGYKYGRKK